MSVALAKIETVRPAIHKLLDEFEKVAPAHIDPTRLGRMALNVLQKNWKLQDCSLMSFLGCCMQSAELGLYPDNNILGHCYYIPFDLKKGGKVANFIPGYRGMIDLARRSGDVGTISAHPVYEGDHFIYELGLNEILKHVPKHPDKAGTSRGDDELIAVYAITRYLNPAIQPTFDVMWRHEIEKVRRVSKAKNDGPWVSWYIPMSLKSVVRRSWKYLPISVEIQTAVTLDDLAAAGVNQKLTLDSELQQIIGETDVVVDSDTGEVVGSEPEVTLDDVADNAAQEQETREPSEFDRLMMAGIDKLGDEEMKKKLANLRRSIKTPKGVNDKLIAGLKQIIGEF